MTFPALFAHLRGPTGAIDCKGSRNNSAVSAGAYSNRTVRETAKPLSAAVCSGQFIKENQMKSLTQMFLSSSVALVLIAGAGCMSNGSTTAQAHDDAWCSSHPKQCDNKDWCAKNPGQCATGSSAN